MNREHGYTLMETLVTLTLMMILSVGGLYGWQRWQQQQRLWQTAVQVRDFLLFLRDDANATTGTACFASARTKWAGA
jgi:prepilin peptidase dependent protein A